MRRGVLEAKISFHQTPTAPYGAPRINLDLHEAGDKVSVNPIAARMFVHGIVGVSPGCSRHHEPRTRRKVSEPPG